MSWDDHHLEAFRRSVSKVILKHEPNSFLSELLTGMEVDIEVGGSARLDDTDLYDLPWAGQITRAILRSDGLSDSANLYELSRILELTLIVAGTDFDDSDVSDFSRAIVNLETLKQLKIIVEPAALDFVKTRLSWPQDELIYSIETKGGHRSKGRGKKP
ncbi:MAG: hypothetical protein Q4G26_13435 [Paracoccus sp. (in: a-proteobacteria)]|nr:hypothetical protein [Paracoccus sp. (in: a-proteobacteria)]